MNVEELEQIIKDVMSQDGLNVDNTANLHFDNIMKYTKNSIDYVEEVYDEDLGRIYHIFKFCHNGSVVHFKSVLYYDEYICDYYSDSKVILVKPIEKIIYEEVE